MIEETEVKGYMGEKYKTEQKEYEKYNFVKTEGKTEGTITEKEDKVTYYYEKKKGKVTVIYETENGKELAKEE